MMGGDGTTSSDNDNYLKCSAIDKPQLCIEESHLEHVLYLAKEIQSHLETIAGSFTCDKGSKRNETIQDLILKYNASIKDLEKVFYFFLFNPHRGINTYRSNGDIISDHILGVTTSDVMESIKPKMTISCHLRQSLLKNTSLIYSLVGVVLIIIGIIVYNILQHQRMKKQATVYAMIDDIMEVLKAHHQKCQRNDGLLPYVAIVHVRDMLIPPSEREKKQKIWDEAVKMIAMNESRVRVETRRIAGEDFTVWNWIHVEPPPTEVISLILL
jgi:membrane protein Man1